MASILDLPTELILIIMENLPNPPSLLNFVKSCHKARDIFLRSCQLRTIYFGLANLPQEIFQLAVACMMAKNNRPTGSRCDIKEFAAKYLHLETVCVPIVECDPSSNSHHHTSALSHLQDLASYYSAIDDLVLGFFSARNPDETAHMALFLSEIHRIQRALWRYQLYCLLFSQPTPRVDTTKNSCTYPYLFYIEAQIPFQVSFLLHFFPWELEELECVYDYLYDILCPDEDNTIKSPSSGTIEPIPTSQSKTHHMSLGLRYMQSRYHKHIALIHNRPISPHPQPLPQNPHDDDDDGDNNPTSPHREEIFFLPRALLGLRSEAPPGNRYVLGRYCYRNTTKGDNRPLKWADSPAAANGSNAAWNVIFPPRMLYHDTKHDFVTWRLQAWCMWDDERLALLEVPHEECYEFQGMGNNRARWV